MHVQPTLRDVDSDKTSFDAVILSPSCDCGREPRQLLGREMKDSAGALLDTGQDPMIANGRGAATARTWPRPALWMMADRQDSFVPAGTSARRPRVGPAG